MFKLAVLVSTVACALGAAIPDGLGPQLAGRIVDGEEASISQFPYQISLIYDGYHSCGGSVFSESVILTAAHCVAGVDANTLKIRAGSIEWSSGGVVVDVSKILTHPRFDHNTNLNDIALLKLATPLPLGPTIRAIKLVKKTPIEGTRAVVSGWGLENSESLTNPTILRYAYLKIISRKSCSSETYSYGTDVMPSMFCATDQGKDSCQDDSGGPLAVEDGLAGIVSFGRGCAESQYPGVYTDVATFSTWILKNVESL